MLGARERATGLSWVVNGKENQMWSDPIDELIGWCERLMDSDEKLDDLKSGADRSIFIRTLNEAREHRKREQRTGKVGFEATNG